MARWCGVAGAVVSSMCETTVVTASTHGWGPDFQHVVCRRSGKPLYGFATCRPCRDEAANEASRRLGPCGYGPARPIPSGRVLRSNLCREAADHPELFPYRCVCGFYAGTPIRHNGGCRGPFHLVETTAATVLFGSPTDGMAP